MSSFLLVGNKFMTTLAARPHQSSETAVRLGVASKGAHLDPDSNRHIPHFIAQTGLNPSRGLEPKLCSKARVSHE